MEKTDCKLLVMSSVRDADEQKELYNSDSSTAAAPGASEHQTGLGIDVYVKNFAGEGFVKSQAGQFVNSESWKLSAIRKEKQNLPAILTNHGTFAMSASPTRR